MTTDKQVYLQEIKNLKSILKSIHDATPFGEFVEVPASKSIDIGMQRKRCRARHVALTSAQTLLTELSKQIPLTDDDQDFLKADATKHNLFALASACSRTSQGLRFLSGPDLTFIVGKTYEPFACEILDSSGQASEVTYDIAFHQKNMGYLSEIASSLTGHRWEKTRTLLLTLAAALLITAGIIAAIPTGGIGLAMAVGGAALLTAGVGFFTGTDTGLARAVREIKLESVEDKKNTGNNQTK